MIGPRSCGTHRGEEASVKKPERKRKRKEQFVLFKGNRKRVRATREAVGAMKYKAE